MQKFSLVFLFFGLIISGMNCKSSEPVAVNDSSSAINEPVTTPKPLTTEEKIASIADQYQVKIGVSAKNLKNKKTIVVNSRERIPVTSMLKVPVLISYYEAVNSGLIKPNTSVKLTKSNKVGGSGFLQFLSNDISVLLSDAARLAVISSDNTATNLVIDAFGSTIDEQTAFVNSTMSKYGLIDTKLLNKFLRPDLKSDSDDAKAFGVGYSTASDLSGLMEKLYSGLVISSDVSFEILEIMRNSNDDTISPRFMPLDDPTFSLAHRSGGTTRYKGDFGLLIYKNQPVSFAVICENLTDNKPTIENNGIIAAGLITKILFEELTKP